MGLIHDSKFFNTNKKLLYFINLICKFSLKNNASSSLYISPNPCREELAVSSFVLLIK